MKDALQERYDDAMHAFSREAYEDAIAILEELLVEEPEFFDARLSIGMAYYRMGDFDTAIEKGHEAERLRPQEQLVHTNLSLFYMKNGNKEAAERHGLQARIAGWRGNMDAPDPQKEDSSLKMAGPGTPPPAAPKFPDMPWKRSE